MFARCPAIAPRSRELLTRPAGAASLVHSSGRTWRDCVIVQCFKLFAHKHIAHVSKLLSHCRVSALALRGSLVRAPSWLQRSILADNRSILGRYNPVLFHRWSSLQSCSWPPHHAIGRVVNAAYQGVSTSRPCRRLRNRAECTHNSVSRSAVVCARAEPSAIL